MSTSRTLNTGIIEEISVCEPITDENEWTDLHIGAIDNKTDEILKFIKKWPNYVNEKDIYGSTALHISSRWGHTHITKLLIQNGADINAINNIGWSPLHCASWEDETDCVFQLLTPENTTINQQSEQGWTALHFAARWGYTNVAEALLDLGKAKHNLKDSEGQTPGHQAAIMGRVGVLSILHERKLLNLFDKTTEGKTIIDFAFNNKKNFRFLR